MKYNTMGTLSSVIPQTYGYVEVQIGDTDMSLLVVQRVGYTFALFMKSISKDKPTTGTMSMVTVAVLTVVQHLVHTAGAGLEPYDWHTGNVAFGDDEELILSCQGFKLIDWAGNHLAPAPIHRRARMDRAFMQFSGCFEDFAEWGTDCRVIEIVQMWHNFLRSIHRALRDWWTPPASMVGTQVPG